MKIDLSCPIEVRGYVLSYTENGMQASARLYNLTTRRIASFEAVARWISASDGRKIVCPFSMDQVHAYGESAFRISLDNPRMPDASELEILFNTVRFEDGDAEWHAGNGPFAEMEPLPPLDSAELLALKAAAGEDAVCYSCQSEETWTCICGRMNPNSGEECARCHRTRTAAAGYTAESVRSRQSSSDAMPAVPHKGRPRRIGLLRRTLLWTLALLALTALFALQDPPPRGVTAADAAVLNP